MSSYTRQALEKWVNEIKVPAMSKVLDIGGSQNPVNSRLREKGEGSDYKILDLENPHKTKVEPDIICDLNYPISKEYEGNFNIAFCLEVSEYWWNPVQAMQNINFLLKKGGILYISFHFFYPIHNPLGKDYMRYTEFGVKKLLKETGFEIEELTYREAEEMNPMIFYRTERMRPSKEYKNHSATGYLIKVKKI